MPRIVRSIGTDLRIQETDLHRAELGQQLLPLGAPAVVLALETRSELLRLVGLSRKSEYSVRHSRIHKAWANG
jgi:hypothetical protein